MITLGINAAFHDSSAAIEPPRASTSRRTLALTRWPQRVFGWSTATLRAPREKDAASNVASSSSSVG